MTIIIIAEVIFINSPLNYTFFNIWWITIIVLLQIIYIIIYFIFKCSILLMFLVLEI